MVFQVAGILLILFASKSEDVLNTHPTSTHSLLQTSVTDFCISEVCFSEDDVLQALSRLKANKTDTFGICSEHLKYASSALSETLAAFFYLSSETWLYATMHS